MGNWERLLKLCLGGMLVALGLLWSSSIASADTVVCGPAPSNPKPACPAFSDSRGDYASRPGTDVEIRYGPYTVNANSQIHNAFNLSAPVPCANCYITDIVPNLVYDGDANNTTGTTANLNSGAMMHHFVLINPARPDAVCPSGLQGQFGERFFASGNERTHMHLPRPFGYLNPASQSTWMLVYHLVNKSAVAKNLSIQIHYRYRTDPPNVTEAKPLWLDIDGCGDSEYTIPPTPQYTDTTTSWTSTVTGRMVAIAGHLHDVDITNASPCDTHCPAKGGGIAVSAELVGGPNSYYGPVPPNNPPPASLTGTTMCRSEGYYGTPFGGTEWKGHLDTMSECGIQTDIPPGRQAEAYPAGGAYPTQGVPFKSGDVIKLHSEYQNGTGEQLNDVMGIMGAWYTPPDAGYARPKGASPLRASLVPAYEPCSVPTSNRMHGGPLAYQSCNPPVQSSSFLTMGSPDANGVGANGNGSVTMVAVQGNAATTADEADLKLKTSVLDVRNQAGLSDYTGQLKVTTNLRIVDRDNGPDLAGVVQDTPYSFTVPCATTGATNIGSTCSVDTTADALVPNTIKEGVRSIWQLGQVDVYDGGADGVASTNPNTRFLSQGIFVP
jgi:hypothetical protein